MVLSPMARWPQSAAAGFKRNAELASGRVQLPHLAPKGHPDLLPLPARRRLVRAATPNARGRSDGIARLQLLQDQLHHTTSYNTTDAPAGPATHQQPGPGACAAGPGRRIRAPEGQLVNSLPPNASQRCPGFARASNPARRKPRHGPTPSPRAPTRRRSTCHTEKGWPTAPTLPSLLQPRYRLARMINTRLSTRKW